MQRGEGAAPIRLDSSAVGVVRVWVGCPLSGLPRSFLVFCQRTTYGSPLLLVSKNSSAMKRYILRAMLEAIESTDLLEQIKQRVVEELTGLPNYVCVDSIERSLWIPGERQFRRLDRIHVEVAQHRCC